MRLYNFLGERELTIENVRVYTDDLNVRGLEPGTIYLALRACRAFIRWLATNNLIEDWAKQIELPRLHRKLLTLLDPAKLEEIIIAGTTSTFDVRSHTTAAKLSCRLALRLILRTGLRVNECLSLTSDNLRLDYVKCQASRF